jgi:tetratricopeptide (TPR) repeat protein
MSEILNPYIAGAPVSEARMFFGREDIFQWIENSIAGQYADHMLVVHGQRRVGKTSVLKQLGNRLPERYIPVFFDLQGRTHTTLDHFLWWLARETVRVLKQDRDIEVPPPDKKAFVADPELFENLFLIDLRSHLGNNTLLLTFDEFDNLEESEVKEELAVPLIDYLRRLMGQPNLNFIFSIGSSGRKLENMQAAYTDFFKTALYKKISFLSEGQTHGLITQPVAGVIEYERGAVDLIYRINSGHPYFTQLTCHELFARCQRTEQRKITKADVESVLDDVVERGTVNLKFVWDEASDIEKWSLAALAQLDKADNRALADFLRKQRIRFSDTDLHSGLLHLREKDVLTPQNRFVIHLLRLWLQKNRPIEQVREELTETNPIVSRFIEIGLEFRDGGQHEKAIEYFRQALSVSADNLQAQVNIATTYAAQGQLEPAISEFEKALAIDDEDVASRAGLCDAHLALGDAAMQKGRTKEAVQSYQRVLAINSEHTEARGRMAELNTQRAEKALADGKDEEALSAFSEALKYTPEDPALIARVEKVRAEKNAKVLAAQVARSEKEAVAGNWDKAIAALNEALKTTPGDESILKKLENIKEKQLQEQLDSILAKVEAAEKTRRWDAAIAGLNEYLGLKPDDTTVQKRLADLVEDQHATWLSSVMKRVEQAVSAQHWDEALAALNEALRLEPDNGELQAQVTRVQETQHLAELEAMLHSADQAAGAGRWDEAIDILNDGLAADPDNETLKAKLAEARQARREARLQATLRFVDAAVQTGKWEAAAASLQEVLANEPDNAEFQEKLAEVKKLERESKLDALRTQAQSLLKEEKFDEALSAWKDYLALEPEDREKAEARIDAVKKAQALASLYSDATREYEKKNYEKAIDLLKRIVVEDAEYRDTTDLLAESVRLRRSGSKARRIGGRRIWMTGGLLAILALGIGGGLFWLGKNGIPARPALFADNTAVPTATAMPIATASSTITPKSNATPTNTVTPTRTSTPQPSWVTDFTEPILAAIAGKPPTGPSRLLGYSAWIYLHDNCAPGSISMRNTSDTQEMLVSNCCFQWNYWFTDFVIEMDARMEEVSSRKPDGSWTFHFRENGTGFRFFYNGSVGRAFSDEIWDPDALLSGSVYNHVLIIVYDQEYALFVNDQPIYYGEIPPGYKNGKAYWVVDDPVSFKNIGIWDLNEIQDLP